MIHGPAETGKSLASLFYLHVCACKYPGASIVLMRKTLASTYSTILQTFTEKVLGPDRDAWPCTAYGGENKPQWFDYKNGSRIWITGLDRAQKVLSGEYDLIFANQAEELSLAEWEVLTTRTTGRAGHMPYSRTMGDANPTYPTHWMYHRPPLKLFYSFHKENPALYDQTTGEITEQGKRTMAVLEALTGARRVRLLEGKPVQAEGAVYDEWNEAVHLIYASGVPKCFRHIAGVDWGYRHPGVLGVWSIDGDGRMYLVEQVYRTGKTIDWWIEAGKDMADRYSIERFVCDPSEPAYIDQFRLAGLPAVAGFNSVKPGINAVQERLRVAGDGKPRLFVVRDSLKRVDEVLKQARKPYAVEQEFASYVWSSRTTKEQPVKEEDDGIDALRYAVAYVDGLGEKPKKKVGGWR